MKTQTQEDAYVTGSRETNVTYLQAEVCSPAAKAKRDKEGVSQEEDSSDDTLILTLDLQNYETIHLCCFQQPNLW